MLLEKSENDLASLVYIHNPFSLFSLCSAFLLLSKLSRKGVSNEELPKMPRILDKVANSVFAKHFRPNTQLG